MKRYVLKRLIQSIVVMFIMSICSFALINAAPGEPAAAIYGGQMDKLTQAEKGRINENLTESASHHKVWQLAGRSVSR